MDRVLIIDDDRDLLEAVDDALIGLGYETMAHSSGTDALRALDSGEFNLVLTDVRMPQIDGLRLCDHITGNHPQVPVILMTAYGDVGTAVDAMRARACDFLLKPFTEDQLGAAVRRALERPSSVPGVHRLEDAGGPEQGSLGQLVGSSPAMTSVIERLLRAAPTDSTVLVTGESGTGKELLARALHENSRRKGGPFVALSCAAMPAEVLESELFGHVKGAFTGATAEVPGLLRDASGGTLFLDEIGAMPFDLQPKLLRALQTRSVRPVGGDREEPFDARVVAATNADLHRAVEAGAFCEGLYYRLNVISLHLPPLRERGEDVVDLAVSFLNRHSRKTGINYELSDEAQARLLSYPWPGNVRELENCIHAAIALARSGRITPDELPHKIRKHEAAPAGLPPSEVSLESVERVHIERVLRAVAGNRAAAARTLGIDRATLYRKMKRFNIEWRR